MVNFAVLQYEKPMVLVPTIFGSSPARLDTKLFRKQELQNPFYLQPLELPSGSETSVP